MYILLFNNIWGQIREFLVLIDSVAYELIDNMYDLIIAFASVRFFEETTVQKIATNLYQIISIFALFRLGILLINSIISPDKIDDKETGLSSIFRNFIVMFIILAISPFIFRELFDLQSTIVNNNYIERLFLPESFAEYDEDTGQYYIANPGERIKRIIVEAMIHPDEIVAEKKPKDDDKYPNQYKPKEICENNNECNLAVLSYNAAVMTSNNSMMWEVLSLNMSNYVEGTSGRVYVYKYYVIVTFVVGIAVSYLLLTFALDIAIRLVKIGVLEILSPFFIVTYADPKMAKSGPFHNWLSEYGKAYASLFIRLAVLAIMIILIQNIEEFFGDSVWQADGLKGKLIPKVILIFAILIFTKKLPSWISNLIGIKDDGLSGGGFFRKLGEAALIGGLVKKGLEGGKSKTKEALKRHAGNFKDRRVRGLGARAGVLSDKGVGAFKPKVGRTNRMHIPYLTTALAQASRAERRKLKTEQKENAPMSKTRQDFINAAKGVNPEYKSLRDSRVDQLKGKANISLQAALASGALQTAADIAKRTKELEDQKKAQIYSSDDLSIEKDGNRSKIEFKNSNGDQRTAYVNPASDKEFNEAIGYADNQHDAYHNYGELIAASNKNRYKIDGSGSIYDTTTGRKYSGYEDLGAQKMTYEGRLKVQEMTAKNVATNLANYQQILQQSQGLSNTLAATAQQYNNTLASVQSSNFKDKDNFVNTIQQYGSILASIQEAIELKSKDPSKLTDDEKDKLSKLGKMQKSAEDARSMIANYQSESGINILPIIDNMQMTQKQLDQYSNAQKEYEKIFAAAKDKVIYEENGKPKVDKDNNPVKGSPYVQTIYGAKYDPTDTMHLAEVVTAAQQNQAKAESKAKKAFEEAQKTKKGDGK